MSDIRKSYIKLDEKIQIFERYYKTQNGMKDINLSTVFEGYPIGQWANYLRSHIKNGKMENLSSSQREKLEELGILDSKIESKIDEKIKFVAEWYKKYAKARRMLSAENLTEDQIKKYAKKCNATEEDLKDDYEKAKRYLEYINSRRYHRKLTKEQIEECRKGDFRGVFGFTDNTIKLSKYYRINPKKICYILDNYGSMNNFINNYKNGNLSEADKAELDDNLKYTIDLNGESKENKGYERLCEKVYGNGVIFDSSILIKEMESRLSEKTIGVLEDRYVRHETYSQIQNKREICLSTVKMMESKAINVLKLRKNIVYATNIGEEIKNRIFESNYIFHPDEEFKDIPIDIDIKSVREEAEKKNKEYEEKITKRKKTEELDLPPRVTKSLINAGFFTLKDLLEVDERRIERVKCVGPKTLAKIKDKIHALGFKTKNEMEEEQGIDNIDEKSKDILVDDLNFSTRTFNAISRARNYNIV